MGRRLFPQDVLAFFEANNKGRTAQEMTDLLNTTFGAEYTCQQIKSCRARNHWDSGLTGQFKKGHTPHNKGRKGVSHPGTERTQFKPGQMPRNHRPVGSERVNKDGYRERKIADPKTWRAVHVLNWEAVHGPVPKGHTVVFKDGNKAHAAVENLMLVSRAELAVMNRRRLGTGAGETAEVRLQLVRYIRAATKAKKERSDKR